ncbi:hypothetical protein BDF20DRAFT_847335 [Mycotypha africana]|uniref:uncharacterized protein n=1 Tax=Mycotypha africana TaxID=64632 RepID=UPI0023017299|nr:uncharacterized protein BDF20DRAFT_847335 [Mycotypha africana]KAI8991940.1 hypothetical protein BDF20DRAFT_847335 [Mycotypha africana]
MFLLKLLLTLLLFTSAILAQTSSYMTYPYDGITWKVGERVKVAFSPGQPNETVSVFFDNDRSQLLAAGSVTNGAIFNFQVPHGAMTKGGVSVLVAVHRVNRYLASVDTITIHVVS